MTTIEERRALWSPEYAAYHAKVIAAIRVRMFARWPPKTVREEATLLMNVAFFDEQTDYFDEMAEGIDPEEMADDQIDAAVDADPPPGDGSPVCAGGATARV